MAEKRKFTGAFIPAHIWVSKELIPAEKMMLGEIDCLSKETGWCYAGRKHFAEWLHCTPQNVTHYTNRLVELGYLEIVKVVGGTSRMRLKNKVESRADGGGKPDFQGVESRADGGGKPDFPKIQYKNKSEIQGQRQSAKNEFSPDTADDAPEYRIEVFEPMKVETVRLGAEKQKTSNGARRDVLQPGGNAADLLAPNWNTPEKARAMSANLGDDFAEMLEKEYGVKVVTVPSSEPIPDTLGKAKKTRRMDEPQPFPETAEAFAYFSDPDKIAALWKRWLAYKKDQHRQRYKTADSEITQLRQLWKRAGGDADKAEQIIEQSVGYLWKGLFDLKIENANGKPTTSNRENVRRELVEYYADKRRAAEIQR